MQFSLLKYAERGLYSLGSILLVDKKTCSIIYILITFDLLVMSFVDFHLISIHEDLCTVIITRDATWGRDRIVSKIFEGFHTRKNLINDCSFTQRSSHAYIHIQYCFETVVWVPSSWFTFIFSSPQLRLNGSLTKIERVEYEG